MTLDLTLHVDARAEPREFHPAATAPECYAVSLTLRAAPAADGTSTEDEPRAATGAFLAAAARGGSHYLVTVDGGAIAGVPAPLTPLLPAGGRAPALADWLEKARRALAERYAAPEGFAFYLAADRETGELRNATAFDLLRTAARWPAPVAQNAGLLGAWCVEAAGAGERAIVFLPEGCAPEDIALTASAGGTMMLSMPWLDGQTIAALCETLTGFDRAVLPANFGLDGWIAADAAAGEPETQALAALSGRIEADAATALWSMPVLQSLLAAAGGAGRTGRHADAGSLRLARAGGGADRLRPAAAGAASAGRGRWRRPAIPPAAAADRDGAGREDRRGVWIGVEC